MNLFTIDEIIDMQLEPYEIETIRDRIKNIFIIASEQAYWQGRKDMLRSDKEVVFSDYLKTINK